MNDPHHLENKLYKFMPTKKRKTEQIIINKQIN